MHNRYMNLVFLQMMGYHYLISFLYPFSLFSNMIGSDKRWKYLSFALIGVLTSWAIITVIPQANAATKEIHQQILDLLNTKASQASVTALDTKVTAIKDKTDNLPSDPADQSEIDGVMFSNLETGQILTFANQDEMNCTADADFLIHASLDPTNTALLEVKYEEANGDTNSHAFIVSEPSSLTLGQEAGRWYYLRTLTGGGDGTLSADVTAQSTEGSNLSCNIS